MSPRKAERLTGYEVRRLRDGDSTGQIAYAAFRGDELVAEAAHRTEELALRILVDECTKSTVLKFCDALADGVTAATTTGDCRFIIANTGRTGEATESRT